MTEPQPPADPAAAPPPVPAPAAPASPAAPPPADPAPTTDTGILDTLMNGMSALQEAVAKLQPNDSRPVPKPWTHWGSK